MEKELEIEFSNSDIFSKLFMNFSEQNEDLYDIFSDGLIRSEDTKFLYQYHYTDYIVFNLIKLSSYILESEDKKKNKLGVLEDINYLLYVLMDNKITQKQIEFLRDVQPISNEVH